MISNKSSAFLLSAIAALLVSLYLIYDIFEQNSPAGQSQVNSTETLVANSTLKKIEKCLSSPIKNNTFVYNGTFESPFRVQGEISNSPKSSPNAKTAVPDRPKLTLKGILQKSAPLAILEDQTGETYIRGIGEKALDQEIVKITYNKVSLRDSRGTYDLMVEEQ